MSDSEDKRLTTSSQPDGVTTAGTSPLAHPTLVLRIASLLGARDLVSFRMCNKRLYNISRDIFWRRLLRDLPLPRALRPPLLDYLSYPELEKAALDSLMVKDRWLRWRKGRSTLLQTSQRHSINIVRFLDDRWAICMWDRRPPSIWDTQENPPRLYGLHLHESMSDIFSDYITSAEAAVDPLQGDIIIAVRCLHRPAPRILRVHLADLGTDRLQVTAYPPIEDSAVVGLEPSRNLVLTIDNDGMRIYDWIRGRVVRVADPFVPPVSGGFKPSVRLVGDYILRFKSERIELFSIPSFPDANEQIHENDPVSYRFHLGWQGVIFSGASLSEGQPNPKSPDDSLIVYILARRSEVGFFYFRVTIYNLHHVPSGPRARMDVDLLGVYDLSEQARTVPGGEFKPYGSSGAWLGPQGKRGFWIERGYLTEHTRWGGKSTVQLVVAVSFDQDPPGAVAVKSGVDLQELCTTTPKIKETGDAFIVKSQDPCECSFSEATGKIVLGTVDDNHVILL